MQFGMCNEAIDFARKAYLERLLGNLIDDQGLRVALWLEGEPWVNACQDIPMLVDELMGQGDGDIIVKNHDKQRVGWFGVIFQGEYADEIIYDYAANEVCEAAYMAAQEA